VEQFAPRLRFLRSVQNPDGGWGYFPGKQSWLEPTVWAALAIAADRPSIAHVTRAWAYVRSWQNPDGGWPPAPAVRGSGWGTALALTLADVVGERGPALERGVRWLLASTGVESSWTNRLARRFGVGVERDVDHVGWPWRPGTSAWVEPTVHSLIALRKVAYRRPDRAIAARLEAGEELLLVMRCEDGGWNYGSPKAVGVPLPSYAETTALALAGLQDRAPAEAFDAVRRWDAAELPPLARAWLAVALRLNGKEAAPCPDPGTHRDVLLTAVEALGTDNGSWRLLRPGARL
jgi:hypothetical protein